MPGLQEVSDNVANDSDSDLFHNTTSEYDKQMRVQCRFVDKSPLPRNKIRYWALLIHWILFCYWVLIWTVLVLVCGVSCVLCPVSLPSGPVGTPTVCFPISHASENAG